MISDHLRPKRPITINRNHRSRSTEIADHVRRNTHYTVGYIAIDTTGMGQGVYQLVRKFYPGAVALNYSPEVKTRLVLKGQSVIRNARLQFDAGCTDLAASFMAIKQTMTASGRQATYTADRNDETGHADLAWACLHAIDREPLAGGDIHASSFTEFYS